MPGPQYNPDVTQALELAWPGLVIGDSVDYPAHQIYAMIAKYYGQQVQNELLGVRASCVGSKSLLQNFTCAAGDLTGNPVRFSGNNTVTTSLADTTGHATVAAFIKHKGAVGVADDPSSTTCQLEYIQYVSGLSGGTAGATCYLTDAGGYSATPGTVIVPLGEFISTTEAILFTSPNVLPSIPNVNPGLFPEIDMKALATTTLTIPNGMTMNPFTLILRLTTLGGTLTGQPIFTLGKTGSNSLYLGSTTAALPTTVGNADVYISLLVSTGTTSLTFTVGTAATGSSTIKATPLIQGACF